MSEQQPPAPHRCDHGVLPEDLATLVVHSLSAETASGLREHADGCEACRTRIEALEWTASCVAARLSARAAGPGQLLRLPAAWRAAAALLLAALAVGAVAASWPRLAGVFGRRGSTGTTAGDAARVARLDLDAAGIPPEAVLLRDVCDVRLDRAATATAAPGSLIAFRWVDGGTERTGVAAFDAVGAVLWRTGAGTALPSWSVLLPGRGYGLTQLRVMNTRVADDSLEQTGVATISHGDQSAILLFDPVDGSERGIVWHDGQVATDAAVPTDSMSPAPIPADATGARRHLLFAGSDPMPGGGTSPCVVIAAPDGRVLQHVHLPQSGPRPEGGSRAVGTRVAWPRPGDPSGGTVTIFTSDEMDWDVPILDGRLDIGRVALTPTDAFPTLFDRTSSGRRFADVARTQDELRAYLAALRSAVRDDPTGTTKELWGR